jgi:hypothetical protein
MKDKELKVAKFSLFQYLILLIHREFQRWKVVVLYGGYCAGI